MALSDATVRQARPRAKPYTLKDSDGLALYVSPSGARTWNFRFYWFGQQQRISFGTYPEIGLKDARVERDKARALVAKGIDPRVHRREERAAAGAAAANTFQAIFQQWRNFKAMSLKPGRQSTLSQIDRIFDKDILPTLRHLSIFDIKRQHLLEVLRKIERRNALTTAEKCRTWFNQLFRYAMVEVNLPENPAADLDIVAMPQPPVQHNPFLRMHSLPAFLRTLNGYGGDLKTRLGVWLLFLTGVRTCELRSAMPDQLHLDQGLWIIPPENVKQLQQPLRTEDRDIPPYIVPLCRQAVEIFRYLLAGMRPVQRYVLAHRSDLTKRISENTLNGAIKRMGYSNQLTGHGIRATISTALNELGYKKQWVDAQLSHTDPDQISAAYNHAEYVEQRRLMMQDWADRLDNWASQPAHEDEAIVVSLAQAAASQAVTPANLVSAETSAVEAEPPSTPVPIVPPPTPMAIVTRRDQRPQPVLTEFQRQHAEMVATFEAPHNLPLPLFAKLAGKSRDQINREIKSGRLLSISLGNRGKRIPEWQLDPTCQRFMQLVMERARRVDSWVLYRALSEPQDELDGLAPVNVINASNLGNRAAIVFAHLGLD